MTTRLCQVALQQAQTPVVTKFNHKTYESPILRAVENNLLKMSASQVIAVLNCLAVNTQKAHTHTHQKKFKNNNKAYYVICISFDVSIYISIYVYIYGPILMSCSLHIYCTYDNPLNFTIFLV